MSTVLPFIVSNFSIVGLAVLFFFVLGWLWFQPGTRIGLPAGGRILSRLTIYPILGWMLALVGANWLRIFAVPFHASAPWLLILLFVAPAVFRLGRLGRSRPSLTEVAVFLRGRAREVGIFALVVIGFGLVSINRMTVPTLYDVGSWGYDQENYVHIADQYLDHGMLEAADAPSGNILSPWLAMNRGLFKGFFSHQPLSQAAFSTAEDMKFTARALGLFMRNAGAALDASLATWFRLDTIQAYALSGYLQYIFLVLAGWWIGLALGLRYGWGIFLGAVAALWPIEVLPSLVDNRDQTLALVIILVLLGAVFTGSLNHWIRGLILAALALTYIEILPLAMGAWALLHFDEQRAWLAAIKRMFAEGVVALGCSFIFVPWGISYLQMQFSISKSMKFAMLSENQFGPLSNFAGSFAGWSLHGAPFFGGMAILAGAGILGMQLTGLGLWVRERRYFGVLAFLILAGLAGYLQQRDISYSAYKFFTVVFPLAVLLCATVCRFLEDGTSRSSEVRHWTGTVGRKLAWIFLALCLPGIALGAIMRSGFNLPEMAKVHGWNAIFEDPAPVDQGLHLRSSDILAVRAMVRHFDPAKGVLVTNFTAYDLAYISHFLRERPVKFVDGLAVNEWDPAATLLSPNHAFLGKDDSVGNVLALCGAPIDPEHPDPMEDIVVLRGKAVKVHRGRTFACFNLGDGAEFAFVQRIFSQVLPLGSKAREPAPNFSFGPGGIALGVYYVNATKPVNRVLKCDIFAGIGGNAGSFARRAAAWKCMVDGKEIQNWTKVTMKMEVQLAIPLSYSPAGHVVEVATEDRLPMGMDLLYGGGSRYIGRPAAVNEMVNFSLEDVPK